MFEPTNVLVEEKILVVSCKQKEKCYLFSTGMKSRKKLKNKTLNFFRHYSLLGNVQRDFFLCSSLRATDFQMSISWKKIAAM